MGGMKELNMKIKAIKSTMVPPISETPKTVIWNANVDLVVPRIHVSSVYFYRPTGSPNFFDADIIREAIGKTLVPFYPMGGRLMMQEDGRVAIKCEGQGVLLVEAESEACIDDFGDFACHPAVQELVPKVEKTDDFTTYPLLVLQITKFKCGGAAFGVGMQHHVADGMSGIQFINTISDFARGAPVAVDPYMDRTLLRARSNPIPKFPHVEYQPAPALLSPETTFIPDFDVPNLPPTNGKANGAEHKDDCHINGNAHLNGYSNGNGHVSTPTNGHGNGIAPNGHLSNGNGHESNGHANGVSSGTDAPIQSNGTDFSPPTKTKTVTAVEGKTNGVSDGVQAEKNLNGGTDGVQAEKKLNGGTDGVQAEKKLNGVTDGVQGGHEAGTVPSMDVAVFVISREKLGKLKKKALHAGNSVPYSTYEMLSGHIWKCMTQARGLDGSQPTKLYIATDGRARLVPRLPKDYFGNVIFTATPMSTAGEIVAHPISYAAGQIHDAVARMDDEYLRSALDFLELQPDLSKLVRGAHSFRAPNLGITSWARLPLYDCDFGWGRPIFMGPACIAYDGLVYVLPSPVNDGSFTISLGLRADYMRRFEKLILNVDEAQ